MTQKETLVLVNPSADKGHALPVAEGLRAMVEGFGGADWAGTEYPAHGIQVARHAAESGYKLVIVAGGDGTVHEVINGLMAVPLEQRPRLGIVPLGSGNDFAFSMGIPRDPAEALKKVFHRQFQRIDVGAFDLNQGSRAYFNNTFGMGFDATVTIRTQKIKYVRGFLMYLIAVLQTILFNHDAPCMDITVDGNSWQEETMMLVACNGPREGGGFAVAPDAVISDGYLDFASVCRVSRGMMLRLIPEVMKGTHGKFKQVKLGKFQQLHVESERPLTIHADGEVICGFNSEIQRVHVEVVPGAIEIAS
jgi:diacylglycerol kinase (ATP)